LDGLAALLPAALVAAGLAGGVSGGTDANLDATPAHHLLVTSLRGVHNATQVISVTTSSYGRVHASVRAFTKTASGWKRVAGPWTAWIGENGFAPPGAKREGDGRTPSGSYTFSFMFGVDPNPGVHYRWRHAGRSDYWDDDPASPRYNLWTDIHRHSAGRNPEPMHVRPAYEDGAVINYNASRTPGRGSAIFLHVTHHSPTSGCVSLPRSKLLRLLRWLRPGARARIIMGTAATVTR
jgi:L,D-peptidoglycan transpeptidase YkuD (ErfK/YbiS/YcfS/YnhG family)